jgi:hypothetical protein
MLALNITTSLRGELDDRPRDVRSCTAYWWNISNATLSGYADVILAVASNVIAGVFRVRDWKRDLQVDDKVVFDLVDAPEWQWLLGQDSPVTWHKSQANPVRKVGTLIVGELQSRRPHHAAAGHGWSLDVDPGGNAATVHAPGLIAVTAVDSTIVRMAITHPVREESRPPRNCPRWATSSPMTPGVDPA